MSSKRILVSGHITSQIEAWQETSDTFCYGLVLGHFGGKELMVVHLARQGSLEKWTEHFTQSHLYMKLQFWVDFF